MGLKLLKQKFLDDIDWEYKKQLLQILKKEMSKQGKKEISNMITRLNYLGEVGVDIQHKPSQVSFSSYQNVFKLRQAQENEPQIVRGVITIFDKQEVTQDIPHRATFYVYKANLYVFEAYDTHTKEEQQLLIKEHYFKQEKKFEKLRKEIKLYEKFESSELHQSREPIPEEVKFFVWRRDGGKCVKCGSKENLEFDHIIPLSKGGSNTARNIQLLCEKCNREKSDKI